MSKWQKTAVLFCCAAMALCALCNGLSSRYASGYYRLFDGKTGLVGTADTGDGSLYEPPRVFAKGGIHRHRPIYLRRPRR